MVGSPQVAVNELNRRFLLEHPLEAAFLIEAAEPEEVLEELSHQSPKVLAAVWSILSAHVAAELTCQLPDETARDLLSEMQPNHAVRVLSAMNAEQSADQIARLDSSIANEIRRLLEFPEDTAGRLMDPGVMTFRGSMTVGAALDLIRKHELRTTRSLFVVDETNRLAGKIAIQDAAVEDQPLRLDSIMEPVLAAVSPIAPQSEVAQLLESHKMADLPVVGVNGELIGIVYHATLLDVIQRDAASDMLTMVGASRDERALSTSTFAVRKRLPWLQINLLTAFLAAAVVGLFESTIAKFTALAVLLPVVAGQSGNAGAQALAVTMRGLALREITVRQWMRVSSKEAVVGFANGLAVALTCGIGVFVWSGSFGLVAVIASSMVLAMIAAGLAGAIVPIALTRLGQDPAVASSIILTTVTDIAGFFSFLGIATLLASML
jgi:magnesium transporter